MLFILYDVVFYNIIVTDNHLERNFFQKFFLHLERGTKSTLRT